MLLRFAVRDRIRRSTATATTYSVAKLIVPVLCLGWGAVASAQDMPLTQVLLEDEAWELVSEGHRFTEGPAVDKQGNLYFTDVPASKIFRVDSEGEVHVFAEDTGRTNGLMFGPDGRLYGCRMEDRQIVAWKDGEMQVLAEDVDCNDLVVLSTGEIYFTDPPNRQVWHLAPDGSKQVVAKGFRPNGVIAWADEGTLVVTDSEQPHLWAFRIEKDGSLKFGERYYGPLVVPPGADRPGSDGMTVDSDGRLYVATLAGLQMFDPTGRLGGVIAKPQNAFLSNAVFGGPQFDTLYVTCTDKVYRRKTKVKGAAPALFAPRPSK